MGEESKLKQLTIEEYCTHLVDACERIHIQRGKPAPSQQEKDKLKQYFINHMVQFFEMVKFTQRTW